jgi:hypothetical protein
MPRTKLSEYSTTNSDNTDIESINIAEGCPPSSINNAIRELMVHLKEFQTGASGDAFTFAGGTLMSGTNTISGAAVISGNINSSGTNTFSGTQVIETTDNTNAALRITQLGTGNALLVEDSTNPDSTPFVIDASGNVIAGFSSTIPFNYTSTSKFQVAGTNQGTSAMSVFSANASNALPSSFLFGRSRGTLSSQTAVSDGDDIGQLLFEAHDGTALIPAAQILVEVDGTPGTNDMPGRLRLFTTADGAATPTERMRINSAGNVGIATTAPAAKLNVAGNTILSNVDMLNASYDSVSFSVAGEETSPAGLFFSPDGTRMYVTGSSGDDVNQYSLSTPWVVSSATYVTVFSISSQDTVPQGIFFRADGLKMYIVGQTNDTVYQYALTIPWAISTASYESISFSVASQETDPRGVFFKPNGFTMYVVGSTGDAVYQYALSTAWNVSTATFTQSFSISGQETVPQDLSFTGDGSRMFILGSTGDDVTVYNLTTPWDISTAATTGQFSVSGQDTIPQGLYVKPDGTKFYMLGANNDAVYQYTIPSIEINLTGTTNINGGATVAQDLTVDGNLQALNVRSGTWTPTLTNTTNIAASTNAICQFTLVGNVVTFSGTCSIDPTATGSVVLGISLPVPSNFATAVQAGGTLNANDGTIVGAITSDSTNDRLTMTGNASGTANVSCSFSGSYLVV